MQQHLNKPRKELVGPTIIRNKDCRHYQKNIKEKYKECYESLIRDISALWMEFPYKMTLNSI